jgi:hypothetical protein
MSKKVQTSKKYSRKVHEGGRRRKRTEKRRRKTNEKRRKVRVSEYDEYYGPTQTEMKRR